MNHRRSRSLLAALLVTVLLPAAARGQVGSALIAVPWQPGQTFNSTNYYFGLETDSEATDFDTDLHRGVTLGRVRFDEQDPHATTLGWLYDHTDLDTDDPALPERLVATAAAVGLSLGQPVEGWDVSVSLGGGFAGDQPFADEDAWYAVGGIVARHRIDRQHFVTLLLDFDGSRAIFPDLPLPGIQYTVIASPELRYSLGLPFSTLYYAPDEHWVIDIQYAIPIGGRATVEYRFDETWTAFGTYAGSTRGFHLDGDVENRRLFFSQQRLEAGLRFKPTPEAEWTLAGGWAFDQEFTRGWDVRDDELVRELDDAPFLRIGLKVSF
jgi:hypothetical protein